jgi:hypothetical protein
MHPTPIFLHSSWRTGSTYVWAKFRALAETYCYFEPLNEHLPTATQSFIDRFVPWSYARHPLLDAPYLEEFRPLLARAGGVPGFPTALTYGRYCVDRTGQLPELLAYFSKLDAFARCLGKVPVFGCVRTDLRLDWFKHHFAGIHIFILRDPRRQFTSYLRQAVEGNRYFLERGWVILGANRDNPVFAPLRKVIEVPAYDGPHHYRDPFYARQAWNSEWSTLYMIFYYLHLLGRRKLTRENYDLLIDIDRLSCSPDAAAAIEAQVTELTGAEISFADCKIESYDVSLKKADPFFAEIEARTVNLLNQAFETQAQ